MDELAPERARHVIAARWPSLHPRRAERMAEGGEFATFLVDDALIVRFAPERGRWGHAHARGGAGADTAPMRV